MKRFMVILISLALAIQFRAAADIIYVSGDVSGTWSADTVIVTGEVRVPPGETLVIEPGVKVLFQVYCKFIVDNAATLLAVGTETDSILFDELTSGTNWKGVRMINASDSCKLKFCHLTNGLLTTPSPDIVGGAIYCYSCSPTIQNCLIDSNFAYCGGGIYCKYSNALIANNIIVANEYMDNGGGISCYNSNPVISTNIIVSNTSSEWLGFGGGLYIGSHACPVIHNNIISQNLAFLGGGIACFNSNVTIINNIITENDAFANGGGIYSDESSGLLVENKIIDNLAEGPSASGAGICCDDCENIIMTSNSICGNYAEDSGGGFYCSSSTTTLTNNTFSNNYAGWAGGIWAGGSSDIILVNCLLWGDIPWEIYQMGVPSFQVTYSDIQLGWPGTGNIDENPLFVYPDLNDYRLLWESPCIDTGDPDPLYNDPDGTRADMGAFYYDQSMPVRILLTPHEIPYLIPEEGGLMDYTLRATNIDSIPQDMTVWCDVTLPDSSIVGPLLGPVTVTLGAGSTVDRIRTQVVPGGAPMGVYHYNAYAVVGADTSKDSFMFGKLGSAGGDRASGWTNSGDPLQGPIATQTLFEHQPLDYSLGQNYPNPFNATTAIRYQLPAVSFVNLSVYDVSGRKVIELVNGWREAGRHKVTFDGSGLAAGLYVYWLKAGEFEASGKMVLMK